jgi:hypothetical protein
VTTETVTPLEPPDGTILYWPPTEEFNPYIVVRDGREAASEGYPGPWIAPNTDADGVVWADVVRDVARTAPDGTGGDSMERAVRLYRADDPAIAVLADPETDLPPGVGAANDPYDSAVIWVAPAVPGYGLDADEAEVLAARLIRCARVARKAAAK